ncbi:MAG: HEPN domain-containing protein [Thermus sp.]|nr:HEPN domain-containing protein [Thermus sp.]MCX7848616.1 HEPN domain-containing protein [Thermus sp.]
MAPLDREAYGPWRAQALRTLRPAAGDFREGDGDWASFKAHQAGALGLKGLLRRPASPIPLLAALEEAFVEVSPQVREASGGWKEGRRGEGRALG